MAALLPHMLKSGPLKILLLTLLYVALGRSALLLAIPPGFAMAIYPPAGLALGAVLIGGYRLMPGVLLGSLCLNLWISHDSGLGFSLNAFAIALLIAIGAALQAGVGSWLIRRLVGYPNALDSNQLIFSFVLLAGPVSCLLNASVGVSTLLAFGVMQVGQIGANWLTWWVGDALGAMILTPMCLILFGRPHHIWHSRRFNVLLPLVITLVVMVSAFLFVRRWEQNQFQLEFRETAMRLANSLQTRLDNHVEIQKNVVSLFVSTDAVSARQFQRFVAQPVTSYAALQAIEWAPRITFEQRTAFEQQMRRDGKTDFMITETHAGQLVPAADRAEYFPVQFVAPLLGNDKAIGLDLASSWMLRQTINEARDLGMPVASEPLALGEGKTGVHASLLVSALYDRELKNTNRSERRQAINGVLLTVLRIGDVLDGLLTDDDKRMILFGLKDGGASAAGGSVAGTQFYFDTIKTPGLTPIHTSTVNFAGRELLFMAHPAEPYFAQHKSWAAWGSMVGGMLFTCLVGMYLLFVSGRSYGVEALIARRTHELHDSEHRLQAILQNAAEGILTFDQAGYVMLANRAANHLLGYTDGNLLGQAFASLFFEDGQAMQLDQTLPLDGSGPVFREVMAHCLDGHRFDVALSLAKLARDEQVLYIVIIHDLTEKKRVELLKSEFVSTVSHELRTPLTSIRGSLGLLVGGAVGVIPESAQKLLKLANDNAERLSNLINDILDFERLEYGGMLFKTQIHDMGELLKKAVEINQGYAQKFSIRLAFLPMPQLPCMVRADSDRLIQVLTNLISNAIKFSLPQGQVEIALEVAGSEAVITVIDHGIGIAQSFQGQIFSKFSQADGSGRRKYAGTGLGLSLSKSMIEKMHGRIGFDSREGQGARFFIALPLVDESSDQDRSES